MIGIFDLSRITHSISESEFSHNNHSRLTAHGSRFLRGQKC
jgi:hypothetical protein